MNSKKITSWLVILVMITTQTSWAEQLVYSGDQQQAVGTGVGAPYSQAAPVSYNTNYENQYSPYSSFMASPYGPMPATANAAYLTQQSVNDPMGASEVSPYSKYSPYFEIVGEGSTYTLGIDDVVTVIVRNQPDFSGRFIINPEGNIQYNFVGDVPAVGKTKDELKELIVENLRKYVRYPEVAVMISEYRSKNVYVFGMVGRPGKYAMKGDRITVKEAIVAAGLGRPDAALSRVYVVRPSENTESGEAEKKKVDVNELLNKGDSSEDFFLQPGDTIIVNQRYFDKFVNTFSRVVGPLFQAASVYELGFGSKNGGFLRSNNK